MNSKQNGFSLIEVLISSLLFAISVLGLLQYQQALVFSLKIQSEYKHAILLAHQRLNLYEKQGIDELQPFDFELPTHWVIHVETQIVRSECKKIKITAHKQLKNPLPIQLERIFCY